MEEPYRQPCDSNTIKHSSRETSIDAQENQNRKILTQLALYMCESRHIGPNIRHIGVTPW